MTEETKAPKKRNRAGEHKYSEHAEYIKEYERSQMKQIKFALNKTTDAEIIAHLEQQPNVRRYLIELIQADMAK